MDNERTQWAARMLAQRVNGMAVLYPAALRMKHPFPQMEEKYAKLAYCSRYAFSAARSQRTPEEAAPDSVLSFRYLGHIFVKAAPESWEMTEICPRYRKLSTESGAASSNVRWLRAALNAYREQ